MESELPQNLTDVCAGSASGFCVPATLIYPTKKMKDSPSYGASPGTVFFCQDKSWVDFEVFCERKRHFISVVKPMSQENMLLNLDGHRSHSLSLAATEMTRKYEVVLSLSSHSTRRMQPLDVMFLKTFSTYMASATASKLREKTWQRLYCVTGRHGLPKGCNNA
jgi:hypothetical protein